MRTRILSEQMIKKRFPHIRYVRIHTEGPNKVTVYAWNEDLQLQDKDVRSLKQYASDYLHPYVCFKVKAYQMVQTDRVPQVQELPDGLKKKAMSRILDQDEIMDYMNQVFPYGRLTFTDYDSVAGTLRFEFLSDHPVNHMERGLITNYISEMIPIGTRCEVEFR
ncbi:hypothetical protein [Paenibacillus sp. UNC451MF]|uniref:hypothetical protein n=1 Tax=Paenibacillus sp. UNC451MF TaxID=1449063 RepID=UPI00048C136D|nr:hypothetical protein [Paenibacillus sp. UNC451MF]